MPSNLKQLTKHLNPINKLVYIMYKIYMMKDLHRFDFYELPNVGTSKNCVFFKSRAAFTYFVPVVPFNNIVIVLSRLWIVVYALCIEVRNNDETMTAST